ncbi:uncharacterized protein LOC122631023 [Vespula pensylvanica]|uniref:uncharacterized protein LOC122631023 n=1 Tax=Vespula pensylvanica TaxID=30213 RepID=UPI001CBA4537|nr:uncharacterized protein LOC122631023 [Vespula pensylvanica]
MNTLKLIIFLICCVWFALGLDKSRPYCFRFTWPGPIPYKDSLNTTCTKGRYNGVPCVDPLIYDASGPPNITKIWNHDINIDDKDIVSNTSVCVLQKGFACIKYSNIYNNAVIYMSHYCGRIIEDKTIAVTSGCFNYQVDAHIIEVCACQSAPGQKPCNTATKQIASILILLPSIIIIFFYHFHNNY